MQRPSLTAELQRLLRSAPARSQNMAKYLLPCSQCERTLEVDAGQAGQSVVCQCGHRMEVPTMRGLSALKRVETAAPVETNDWSKGNGLVLFGLILTTVATAVATYLYSSSEPVYDEEQIRSDSASLPPDAAWAYWHHLESQGINRSLTPGETEAVAKAAERTRWISVAAGVGVLGLVLAALGSFMRPKPTRRGRHPGKKTRAAAPAGRK